jgi:predicted RNA-binding protein with EMAP domain
MLVVKKDSIEVGKELEKRYAELKYLYEENQELKRQLELYKAIKNVVSNKNVLKELNSLIEEKKK